VALPSCHKCGRSNPRRMVGLMTLWFGPFVELRPDSGYFYLCPRCYGEYIQPHVDQVGGKLPDLYRLARHLGLHPDLEEVEDAGNDPEPASPDDAWTDGAPTAIPAGGGRADG
jgi:hypothetical protein